MLHISVYLHLRKPIHPGRRRKAAIMVEQDPGCCEVPDTQAAHQVKRTVFFVDGRPIWPQLNRRVDFPFNEPALAIERCNEDRRKPIDALDAYAVVSREIAKAVRDQSVLITLDCPDDMRTVADYEVGTRINDHP